MCTNSKGIGLTRSEDTSPAAIFHELHLDIILHGTPKYLMRWSRSMVFRGCCTTITGLVVTFLMPRKAMLRRHGYQVLLCTVRYSIYAVREFRAGRCFRKEPWTQPRSQG